jgi:hypothetical protein
MSSYTEGQVHQLMERFQSEGFTSEHLTLLGQYKNLGSIRDILEGRSEIKQIKFPEIDLDIIPSIPGFYSVAEHKKGGKWKYDPTKIGFYLSDKQRGGKINGNDLRKELEGQPVMNANLLDFYLKNEHFIPSEWKGKTIPFWGTTYYSDGLYVRCLYYGNHWDWNYLCISSSTFNVNDPAIVLTK